MIANIEKASGKAYCRSGQCGWKRKIPEGTKCLCISIYSAGGSAVAFYCEACMKPILDSFAKVINDAEKNVSEL